MISAKTVASAGPSIDTASVRKARGAFFTPGDLCDYIASWAIRRDWNRVLEPSCGEAAFLTAAARRLTALGASPAKEQLSGVELHQASSATATALVAEAGWPAEVTTGDFFDLMPSRDYDVVIGNPPYIRYQDFSGPARVRARAAALRAGVALTALASSWAAFTVHAAQFLRPGGRLGLVLPAELLSVNYAGGVRSFLMESFGRVRLIVFTERVFPGVQEEVVLLLAENAWAVGGTETCELRQVQDVGELEAMVDDAAAVAASQWTPQPPGGKWTQALLSEAALKAYRTTAARDGFTTLDTWGDTTLGMVTGNNRYFALSPARVAALELPRSELVPLSPPGSRHLRGLAFTASAVAELGTTGSAVWLFRPPAALSDCSPAAQRYIRAGERAGVHLAYKCKVRSPWWRVPLVKPADLLLTYMNADTPRLTTNETRAHHLNSVHGVYLKLARQEIGTALLPVAALNTMTLLGAETVGRAYGGGMLKLEPKEADLLPIPAPDLVEEVRNELASIKPQLGIALRSGQVTAAARLVDQVLLIGALGMSRADVRALEESHRDLTSRRMARAGRKTAEPTSAVGPVSD